MQRILVVEPESTLREPLELALGDEGYAVMGVADIDMARVCVRVAPYPLVVLIDFCRYVPSFPKMQVFLDEIAQMPPHAYLLMTTQPRTAPFALYNPHTSRLVPVLPMPFDIEMLLLDVQQATQRLAPVAVA